MPRTRIHDEPRTEEEKQDVASEGAGAWDESQVSANGTGGYETPTTKACVRHRWNGGDTCVRCGIAKSAVVKTGARRAANATTLGTSRTRGSSTMEMILSGLWLGMGYAIERQPWIGAQPITQKQEMLARDGTPEEVEVVIGAPPAKAVGTTWKLESGVAGRRINSAFKTNPYYKMVAAIVEPAGKYAEVGALLAPPLLVGLVSLRPQLAQEPFIRSLLVGSLVPILSEQAKMAEQQLELLAKLEGVNEETLNMANQIIDSLIGGNENGAAASTGNPTEAHTPNRSV